LTSALRISKKFRTDVEPFIRHIGANLNSCLAKYSMCATYSANDKEHD